MNKDQERLLEYLRSIAVNNTLESLWMTGCLGFVLLLVHAHVYAGLARLTCGCIGGLWGWCFGLWAALFATYSYFQRQNEEGKK